jgi:hypothetical protein
MWRCAVRYEGENGQIELRDRELIISRQGFRARSIFGKNAAERTVPLDALSGVQLKEATRAWSGWLQLSFGGEPAVELSKGTAGSDANTVTFPHKKRDAFRELHDRLLVIISEKSEAGIDPSQVEWDQISGGLGRFETRANPEGRLAQAERLEKAEAAGLRPDIAGGECPHGDPDVRQAGDQEPARTSSREREQVLVMGAGTYEQKQGIVALTDQRLLFVFHGMLGHAVEDFPLDRLENVQTKVGMTSGDLTVSSAGKSTVIKSIYKSDLKRLADALRQRIAVGSQPVQAAPADSLDVADQLAKFAALRDQGVLTEEEFATQKEKLLNS